jgi:APA family basic amino acid/polyamine antiporter
MADHGVWVFGGLHALAGANSVAELATMLPEDGGSYVYIKRAYGSFFGFAGGINDFVLNCCGGAYISITFGEYLAALFPAFTGYENAAGVGLLVVLALINWIGLRAGDMAQKIMSFARLQLSSYLSLPALRSRRTAPRLRARPRPPPHR